MFDKALAFTLRWEGGAYRPKAGSFDPNPTYQGVTQNTYRRWLRINKRPNHASASVFDMTHDERDAIYRDLFYTVDVVKQGKVTVDTFLSDPLDTVFFDTAVNLGPKRAIRYLQRAVGVTDDGVIGPVTLAAIKKADQRIAMIRLIGQRMRWYQYLYERSVEKLNAWRAEWFAKCGFTPPADCPPDRPAPELAPLKGWTNRVRDLERYVGVQRPAGSSGA